MSVENALKGLILERYNSIREFTLSIDLPYSTLDTILRRGVLNANLANVLTICQALNISADALYEGKIEPITPKSVDKIDLIEQLNTALTTLHNPETKVYVGKAQASEEIKSYVYNSLEICLEMIKRRQK